MRRSLLPLIDRLCSFDWYTFSPLLSPLYFKKWHFLSLVFQGWMMGARFLYVVGIGEDLKPDWETVPIDARGFLKSKYKTFIAVGFMIFKEKHKGEYFMLCLAQPSFFNHSGYFYPPTLFLYYQRRCPAQWPDLKDKKSRMRTRFCCSRTTKVS